jgi:hypothetical protein
MIIHWYHIRHLPNRLSASNHWVQSLLFPWEGLCIKNSQVHPGTISLIAAYDFPLVPIAELIWSPKQKSPKHKNLQLQKPIKKITKHWEMEVDRIRFGCRHYILQVQQRYPRKTKPSYTTVAIMPTVRLIYRKLHKWKTLLATSDRRETSSILHAAFPCAPRSFPR